MGRALRILVVDDDVDNARSLGELFELEGHCAEVVHSGEAAIEAFRREAFDVAFMDVMMPGRNGVDSFLEIRKLCPQARVYMMTGYSVEQLLRQAIDNGALGVMSKPLDPYKLLAALEDVGRSGLVVLADDDPHAGQHLELLLTAAGRPSWLVRSSGDLKFAAAADGDEVLIVDLKAPLITGVEIYKDLKRAGRSAPTVIITPLGRDDHDTLEAMDDVAISGILTKPFDPVMLLDRLGQLAA